MDDSFLEEMNCMSRTTLISKDVSKNRQQIEQNSTIFNSRSAESRPCFPKASTPEPIHNRISYSSPILNSIEEKCENSTQIFPDSKSRINANDSKNIRSSIHKTLDASSKEKPTRKSSSLVAPNDSSALLNAIREIVIGQTKSMSTEIMRSMTELHVDSQANLIKQNMLQTEDLVKELVPEKDVSRVKSIVRENEKLKQDVLILQVRNEELRRIAEEVAYLREENICLKVKLKELSK